MTSLISSRNIRLGAWFPAVAIIAWVILAAMLNTSQFNDNIEQFVWSHGIEWGYWKHPPLPTFLFALMSHLIGPSIYTAYIMAALCLCVTAFFTWKIAEHLLGKHWGTVAILLLGLQLGFSWRAQIYNHNTVLIMMIAATVWVCILAAEQRRLLLWLCAGTLAGLAMLAKYQALLPLLALLAALWKTGALKPTRNRLGLILALAAACLVFAPHLQWLMTHDFLPFSYAKKTLHSTGAAERLHVLIAFLITEIRSLVPALVTLGVFALFFYQNLRIQSGIVRRAFRRTLGTANFSIFLDLDYMAAENVIPSTATTLISAQRRHHPCNRHVLLFQHTSIRVALISSDRIYPPIVSSSTGKNTPNAHSNTSSAHRLKQIWCRCIPNFSQQY